MPKNSLGLVGVAMIVAVTAFIWFEPQTKQAPTMVSACSYSSMESLNMGRMVKDGSVKIMDLTFFCGDGPKTRIPAVIEGVVQPDMPTEEDLSEMAMKGRLYIQAWCGAGASVGKFTGFRWSHDFCYREIPTPHGAE